MKIRDILNKDAFVYVKKDNNLKLEALYPLAYDEGKYYEYNKKWQQLLNIKLYLCLFAKSKVHEQIHTDKGSQSQ